MPEIARQSESASSEQLGLEAENALLREHIEASEKANAISRDLVIKQFQEIERVLSLLSDENSLRKGILDAAHQLSIIYCDLQGTVRLFNLGAEMLLGYRAEKVVDRMALTVFHDAQELAAFASPDTSAETVVQALIQAISRHRLPAREWNYRTADGHLTPVNLSFSIVCNASGEPSGLMCAAMDISALKDAQAHLQQKNEDLQQTIATLKTTQQQLIQAQKMASIGQLAAGVAHEINNPIGFVNANIGTLGRYVGELLGVINAYAPAEKLLAEHTDLLSAIRRSREKADVDFMAEDTSDLVRESLDGLTRVRKIVEDLKRFANRQEATQSRTDINEVIESALNLMSQELADCQIDRQFETVPEIECANEDLTQAFMAILRNAHQAMPSGGRLLVASRYRNGLIEIDFSDSGCGISPEHISRVFDPFFTTRPVGSGTGLGLSLAYGIVEKHGGKITVESTPGKGSLFRVSLGGVSE